MRYLPIEDLAEIIAFSCEKCWDCLSDAEWKISIPLDKGENVFVLMHCENCGINRNSEIKFIASLDIPVDDLNLDFIRSDLRQAVDLKKREFNHV